MSNLYFNSRNLRRVRRVIGKICRLQEPQYKLSELDYDGDGFGVTLRGEAFQAYLQERIQSRKPLLLTRYGCGVLCGAIDYTNQPTAKNIVRYLTWQTNCLGWREMTGRNLSVGDGFYPIDKQNLTRFGRLINDIIPDIDILASIMQQETYFDNAYSPTIQKCTFEDIEPWRWKNPWTKALQGLRVLVVHPFVNTIQRQYDAYLSAYARNSRERIGGGNYLTTSRLCYRLICA